MKVNLGGDFSVALEDGRYLHTFLDQCHAMILLLLHELTELLLS